jgi:hypothetical protein
MQARQRLTAYFESYNFRRLQESLDYRTPEEVYRGLPAAVAPHGRRTPGLPCPPERG